MKILVLDPKIAGISGDMLLSALIDLTNSTDAVLDVEEAINRLENCQKFKVEVIERDMGILAKGLEIDIKERRLSSPADLRKAVKSVVDSLELSDRASKFVYRVIDDLIGAEARLHGGKFHLHEIASLDTIFDVVGTATILDREGYFDAEIYTTPPVLGGGYIKMDHGKIASPAPATLEILAAHGFRYSNFDVNTELTTPTGAALLVNLTENVVDVFPPMKLNRIGYGAGTKRVDGIVNVLRVAEGKDFRAVNDRIVILETNVDDASGEIVGHAVRRLFDEGAVDVYVTQVIGKKNRPANVISVISDYKNCHRMAEVLMRETGTIGVRIYELPRLVAERRKEKVEVELFGKKFEVTVKTSKIGERVINVKPEYEDLRKIAEGLDIPLREVLREVEKNIG
ncbi:nickel pincer cofactor biosynthesis protein LarC [Archaeoglobus sp.]